MADDPTLHSWLEEHTGLSARELMANAAAEIDPLPAVLPPEGVIASRLRDVAARIGAISAEKGGPKGVRVDVAGAQGCAGAALAAAIARTTSRRIVLVSSDLDAARRRAEDVGFFTRSA